MSDDRAWHTTYPELRDGAAVDHARDDRGPAGPDAAIRRCLAADDRRSRLAGGARRDAVVVTGRGTSEHGAMAIAEQLADALRAAGCQLASKARQALDAASTRAPGALHRRLARRHDACDGARARGGAGCRGGDGQHWRAARIAARARRRITRSRPRSSTRSWCHTVAYASSIAGAAVGRAITRSAIDAASGDQETLVLRAHSTAAAEDPGSVSAILTVGLSAPTSARRASSR